MVRLLFIAMKKYIELLDQKVEYTLRKSDRARRIRFAVYGGGKFVVTAPRVFSETALEKFMREKADWIVRKIAELKNSKTRMFFPEDRHAYLTHRQTALDLVRRRLEYFNGIYNFTFNKVRIKSQRTCWGSCSAKGNLNFNYKLAFLPEKISDYVVVHELCHLEELNHSRKFWDLVEKTIPDYSDIRKELRRHSLRI